MEAQDDDPGRRVPAEDVAGRVQAVQAGHGDVHDDDIGRQAPGQGDGRHAVLRLARDFDVSAAVGQAELEALPDDGVVVGDEDADLHGAPSPSGISAMISVPRPGAVRTSRRPLTEESISFM